MNDFDLAVSMKMENEELKEKILYLLDATRDMNALIQEVMLLRDLIALLGKDCLDGELCWCDVKDGHSKLCAALRARMKVWKAVNDELDRVKETA